MSFIENDENNGKKINKIIGDQPLSFSHNIKVTYLYADPLNLENTNIFQTTYNTLSNRKKTVP